MKYFIIRVFADGSKHYIQVGDYTLFWYDLEKAKSVADLFNLNKHEIDTIYLVESD